MKTNFPLLRSVAVFLLLFLSLFSSPTVAHAQLEGCYWQLVDENPGSFSASTAPDAIASVSGSTVTIDWQGLVSVHTWSHPGSTLVPGESLSMDVSVSWDVAAGSPARSTMGGLSTAFTLGMAKVAADRGVINFNTEPSGSASMTGNLIIPAGNREGSSLAIYGFADAAVAGGRVDYTYEFICPTAVAEPTVENVAPIKPEDLEYGRWTVTDMSGGVEAYFPVGKDKDGNYIYDDYVIVLPGMQLPVGTKLITSDNDASQVVVRDAISYHVYTLKKEGEMELLGAIPKAPGVLKVLAGRVKANIGKVLRGEQIEVKTNLATVGIKGTEFILEVEPERTTLKTLEGVVEVTSTVDGGTMLVNPGEMVSAGLAGLSSLQTFNVEEERAAWPDVEIVEQLEVTMEPMGNALPAEPFPILRVILLCSAGTGVLILALILLTVRMIKRGKKTVAQAGLTSKKASSVIFWLLLVGLILVSGVLATFGLVGLFNHLSQLRYAVTAENTPRSPVYVVVTSTPLPQASSVASTIVSSPTAEISTNTPSAQPTVTATATPSGQFRDADSFADDFSSKALGWSEMDDGRKILKYEDGGYSFQLLEKDGFDIVNLPVEFSPAEIAFDVQGVAGLDDGTFGVFCQFQDTLNYYYIEFDLLSGKYVIAQSLDGEYIPLTIPTDDGKYWRESGALKPSDQINHIEISCNLDSIIVRANDEPVDFVFVETPFAGWGSASLFLYVYDFAPDDGYKVIFDNIKVLSTNYQ